MSEIKCACDKFDRLEGAATQGYISQFLRRTNADESTGKTYYRCNVCGTPWVRGVEEGHSKPSLLRLEGELELDPQL